MRVTVISATKSDPHEFQKSPLAYSLRHLAKIGPYCAQDANPIEPMIFYQNSRGLPAVYNEGIANVLNKSTKHDDVLIFVHDDVYIEDNFLQETLSREFEDAHVLGLAGNRVMFPNKTAWHAGPDGQWDISANLSGSVAHGRAPLGVVNYYGPTGQVLCLDGLFLAVKADTLVRYHQLRFDERFAFHLYDLDFSRTANKLGLTMKTVPISVTHASGGNFAADAFKEAAMKYLEKWK